MADYTNVPDDVLIRMAAHSGEQVAQWERALNEAHRSVTRAKGALASWRSQRDDQYRALDERDIPAPDEPESADPSPALADDCDCADREALVRSEGLVCGTCGKVIDPRPEGRES